MFVVFSLFFFKQKTAYEMRSSDWSSDGFSSDLTDSRSSGDDGSAIAGPSFLFFRVLPFALAGAERLARVRHEAARKRARRLRDRPTWPSFARQDAERGQTPRRGVAERKSVV